MDYIFSYLMNFEMEIKEVLILDSERLELLNEDAQVELYLFILGILAADETAAPA